MTEYPVHSHGDYRTWTSTTTSGTIRGAHVHGGWVDELVTSPYPVTLAAAKPRPNPVEQRLIDLIEDDPRFRDSLRDLIAYRATVAEQEQETEPTPAEIAEEFWRDEVEAYLLPIPDSTLREAILLREILAGIDQMTIIEAIAEMVQVERGD